MFEKKQKMSFEFFKQQISRLVDVFGERQYSKERVSMLWKKFANESEAWLLKTVDNFISERATAPLPKDFEEAIRNNLNSEIYLPGRNEFSPTNCSKCGGCGYTRREEKNSGYRVLLRCSCEAGSRRPEIAKGPRHIGLEPEEIFIPQESIAVNGQR